MSDTNTMTDTDTMTNNAVRCNGNWVGDSNRTRNSNGMGDSNGTRNSNRVCDSNGMGDSNGTRNSNGSSDGVTDSNIRIGSSAVVGDLGNIAIGVVGMVGDVLDPAVGKVDRVGAIPEAGSIVSLSLLEGSTRVFISHTILEGVGRDLSQVVVADSMSHRMSYSGMHHRSGHRVHHRPCHSDWSGNSHAMADKAMTSNEAMSSHKTVSSHKTMSCQQLGGGRGGSSQGSDTKEGLRG